MKTFLLAGLICLLASTTPVSAAELDTPFALRIGESMAVGNTGVVVGVTDVIHDSRCPRLVVCVWEGVAEVSMWADLPGGAREEFVLATLTSLPHEFLQEVRIGEFLFRLEALDPYPVFPEPIEPGAYILTLIVANAARTPAEALSMSMAKGRYGS